MEEAETLASRESLPSVGSLPKRLPRPAMGQAEAWSRELQLGLPWGCRAPSAGLSTRACLGVQGPECLG